MGVSLHYRSKVNSLGNPYLLLLHGSLNQLDAPFSDCVDQDQTIPCEAAHLIQSKLFTTQSRL